MNDYPLESFVFYRSFRDAIEEMPDDEKLATLLGICDYALYGVEPKLKGVMSRAVFTVARPSIDANNCRRTNGKKGGRPPKKPMVSNSENQWFSKSERSETESGSETESESESESGSGSGANGADKPPETHFGPELETAFADWLQYKQEKRQAYKPKGLQSLVAQIERQAGIYGESAVAGLIVECMSNGWQGIIWDRLEKQQPRQWQQPRKSWAELARELEAGKHDL